MNLVFEGLVRSTADGKSIEPCLATSWDISDDGLVYTFHLREDVKFSDGTPVTAEDWEYSLERSLELGAWNSLISSIDDVKAVDEKTIDIVLKNPSGSLLASLAAFFCAVVPKDYYSSTDDDTLTGIAAWLCFAAGIKHTSALQASFITISEPVMAPIWTFVFLHETITPLAIVGCVIVIATLLTYNLKAARTCS